MLNTAKAAPQPNPDHWPLTIKTAQAAQLAGLSTTAFLLMRAKDYANFPKSRQATAAPNSPLYFVTAEVIAYFTSPGSR